MSKPSIPPTYDNNDDDDNVVKPLLDDANDDSKYSTDSEGKRRLNSSSSKFEILYHEEHKPAAAWVLALAVLPPILPVFWSYHVSITESDLSFGYSTYMSSKKVQLSHVVSAEPYIIEPLRHWGGWGIRMQLFSNRTVGYICRGGPGVLVKLNETSNQESIYVFSCQDPAKVCTILNDNKENVLLKHELS